MKVSYMIVRLEHVQYLYTLMKIINNNMTNVQMYMINDLLTGVKSNRIVYRLVAITSW